MNTTLAPSRRPLRPDQARSRDRILGQLDTSDRTLLISACGTGKTIVLHSVIEKRNADRTVAFFPSLALVDQTITEWGAQFEGRMRAVVVCSDETVGQRFRTAKKDDELAISDDDFAAAGAQVVRDVDELSFILQTHDTDEMPLVVFSTYQSSEKVAEAQANVGVRFDLLIADEAHKIASKDTTRATARSGKLVLDADAILADKRVFATATPRTFSYKAGSATHRGDEASMDDVAIFGDVAITVGLRDAINMSLLTDYRIHIMGLSPEAIHASAADIDADDPEVRMALGVAALLRARQELGLTRVIAYLNSVERAHEFARLAREAGIEGCAVITGDQPAAERKPKLETLAVDGGVIANVKCLTEGVDVPTLDAVLFVDPRNSKVDIVQAVGRAIRKAPDKEFGHVILPVLHDPGAPEDGWLDGNEYRHVWDVIAQMAANDTALHEYLSAVAADGYAVTDPDDDGAQVIQVSLADARSLAGMFAQMLTLRAAEMNDPLGAGWRANAERVAEHYRTTGKLPSRAAGASAAEWSSAEWLKTQRAHTLAGEAWMTADRLAFLDAHVPGWRIARSDNWTMQAGAAAAFVGTHGRLPSAADKTSDEYSLGMWVSSQRGSHRAGTLSAERVTYLNELNPLILDLRGVWGRAAEAFGAFVADHGRMPVAAKGPEEAVQANWITVQRRNAKIGKLSADKVALLDQLAPGWSLTAADKWFATADAVGAFRLEHGRFPLTSTANPAENTLGRWLAQQRTAFTKGKSWFTTERRDYLDSVATDWRP